MKGQISFVEFLVSTTLFILFVTYFAFQLLIYVPGYVGELKNERVRSEAYQLSEILTNDFGEPNDWTSVSSASRIGLLNQSFNNTNFISFSKVSALNSGCTGIGYDDIKRKLGVDLNFSILVTDKSSGQIILNCRPYSQQNILYNITVRRFFAIDKAPAELTVQVWSN